MKLVNGVWEVTDSDGTVLRFFSQAVASWYIALCADVIAQRAARLGKRS